MTDVPYVAVPPDGGPRPGAPIVLAWHLLDSPRTERAFAAAMPLSGLDAWRIYFGLPLTGARAPAGGPDELMTLVRADVVRNVYRPIVDGVLAEFPRALATLRDRHGLGDGPIGLMGGSLGGAVAQAVLLSSGLGARAAVFINPVTRLRPTIDTLAAAAGAGYDWHGDAVDFGGRLDFAARAPELAALSPRPAVQLILGADDMTAAIRDPAADYLDALAAAGVPHARHDVPGMAHALAEEPGVDPAPQLPTAAEADRVASAWFATHLVGPGGT